jgi:1,4-alpha-glucan branching enzyme
VKPGNNVRPYLVTVAREWSERFLADCLRQDDVVGSIRRRGRVFSFAMSRYSRRLETEAKPI